MEVILASILPALIYAFIIYISTPFKSVNILTSLIFGFIGMISTLFVLGLHMIFPNWSNPISSYFLLNLISLAFLQVAVVEETGKFLAFKLLDVNRKVDRIYDYPISIMFYSMMVSIGFAFVENIMYGQQYGAGLLVLRTFSSLILHMISGIFMGYYIALGRLNTNIRNLSTVNVFLKRHHKWRKGVYTAFGILIAAAYHGAYDFILFLNGDSKSSSVFIMLTIGIIISFFMGKRLSYITIKSEKYIDEHVGREESLSKIRNKRNQRSNNRKQTVRVFKRN